MFEWDDEKSETNLAKHGLAFGTAALAFGDADVVFLVDERFDYEEQRWIALGRIATSIVYVAHTLNEAEDGEEIIRIISARKATPFETRIYLVR